jgi:hypothetical protein
MRARYPDVEGFVERGGVKVGYEVFGAGEPALVFTEALLRRVSSPVLVIHGREDRCQPCARLDRYGAGRCVDYGQAGPEVLALAIADDIGRPVSYRPVETDGAARAASILAELI